MEYLGYTIATNFNATSQAPGKCHSVAGVVKSNASLEEVIKYENSAVVHRIARELHCDINEANLLFEDLKKFLWATSRTESNILPPPKIDEAWHAFILFTQDYSSFCENYIGDFIHHIPHRPEDPILGPEDTKPSIEVFVKLFGVKPSSNWDYINLKEAA